MYDICRHEIHEHKEIPVCYTDIYRPFQALNAGYLQRIQSRDVFQIVEKVCTSSWFPNICLSLISGASIPRTERVLNKR
jgi:hypothetical protein